MAFELGGKKKGIAPSMNVTPLVDVVLVLLIIFMVVTPLMTKQMYMAVPPKPDEKTPPQSVENPVPPLVLTLGTDLIPRVNNEAIPRNELRERLMRMLNARAEKVVFFDAQDEVPYEEALSLIDFVRGGGVKTVAVLADKVAQ